LYICLRQCAQGAAAKQQEFTLLVRRITGGHAGGEG
jgi:hypothetical protein